MRGKVISLVLLFLFALSMTGYADEILYQYGDGKLFMQGGINTYGSTVCESKEETYELEQRLRADGFLLMTTDDRDISDEDLATLTEGYYLPPYFDYFNSESEFNWDMQMRKVYIRGDLLEDALKQLRETDEVEKHTQIEIMSSSVLIDYGVWFVKERAGKVLNEINDKIPSWYNGAGYLEIRSPIDVAITLEIWDERTFIILYVKADTPLLVRMKLGMFVVTDINSTEIPFGEATIPIQNHYSIIEEDTIDNPCILDLNDVITKYEIKPADISGKPDFSWDNRDNLTPEDYNLPVESVEVKDPDITAPDDTKSSNWTIILLVVIVIAVVSVGLWISIKMKGQGGANDE